MKLRNVLLASVLAANAPFAIGGATCGFLNVTIINGSGKTCSLQSSKIYNGILEDSVIPTSIAVGEMTLSFSLEQTYITGPSILLSYRCGNNSISFVSEQNFCFLNAGSISGRVETANNMSGEFAAIMGDYWSGLPGQITWTLS